MSKKIFNNLLLIGILFLVSCSPKTEYTHALPKNASIVVGMELDQMANKAGLNGSEGEKVIKKLKTLMKGGLQGDAAQLAERIIDQPSESGLSFDDKVYLFATPHAEALAILAKVTDEGKLETLMNVLQKESIATPLREESGCRWTQVGGALCAFNNGTFLLLQPSKGDASGMKGTLLSLMRQKEGEGFVSLPEFTKIEAPGNDIASVVNLSAVPYELTTPLRMGLSADIRLEDIKYFVSANFEPGKVVMNSESLISNPKILGFFDTMDKVIQPIQGKYLDYYQGNTLLWASGRIDGKELYRMLCQNPTIKQMLDNPLLPVDVEYIFSSIQGDFAVGRSTLYTDNYLLYADVTNSDFLKTFEDLRPMLALTGGQIVLDNVGTDEYVMRTYEGNYYFGVKDNRLYVTNNRSFAEEAGRTYGASMGVKPWSAEVKQNRLYASVNLSAIAKAYRSYNFTGNKQVDTFLMLLINQCNYLNASMPDWRQGKAELVLNDKDQNLLKLLVSMLEQF
ncbi:MAG: DUF4836 family protein [Bacteroidaceae bacterium]|nr:DUF4836 family protein [Bacteroidaceae bacterium]